jgi:thiamine biosynthesis lipoprotein
MNRVRDIYVCCICAAVIASGAAVYQCDEPPLIRYEYRSAHMGTQFRIVLYTPDEPTANVASRNAFERIAQLDSMLSDYQADSELMQLCSKAGGPPVHVSDELFFVLKRSQEIARQSEGAFDVTVGPVVRLWRRARRQHKLPEPDRLAQALALVGYENIQIDERSQTVQLLKQGMQLDLGGIAKGYAADQAMAELKRRGVSRALVAAAGDIVVSAPPPGEDGWTIGITSPNGIDNTPLDYLLLRDAAVSTSGDLEQFVELDGKRYSHIIDPKTGWALTERLQVTVVARDGTTSDSLATAVSVLGTDHGMTLVESTPHVAAIIARDSGTDRMTIRSSKYTELPKGKPKQAKP